MKLLMVFGTRPEAIKMCPIINELKKRKCEYKVCLTGQHEEMIEPVMTFFGITVDYNLHIMQRHQSLADITTGIISGVDDILEREETDFVLVHGDTTSAYAAALAAFYRNIPVGHVEAGLRTYKMESPFPEEFNRQVVDMISKYYFAPTEWAKQNLLNEGKSEKDIFVTGNTVADALKYTVSDSFEDDNLKWATGSRLIILTVHRRENLGVNMDEIFAAVNDIVKMNPDVKVIYPMHKNPAVRMQAHKHFDGIEQIKLIEPLNVFDFHNYMKHSYLIMTDSGGIQEEAPSLGKPVLILRNTTERPEGIEAGTSVLLGTERGKIVKMTNKILEDDSLYYKMSVKNNPYGDGFASKRIVDAIIDL